MSKLTDEALIFAYNAHKGQVRKYTGEPYICHPISVAAIVEMYGFTDDVIAAALLHDVVEDTAVTIEEIYYAFGKDVGELVAAVTDVSKPEDGNREVRKAIDREHIAAGTPKSRAIKLADLIDNTKSISTYDKGFARIYLKEKELLLKVMQGTHAPLLSEARNVWQSAKNKLEEHPNDSK